MQPGSLTFRRPGDLFENIKEIEHTIVIAHVCNDAGKWGAGFVVPLGRHFPFAKERYLQSAPHPLGFLQLCRKGDGPVIVANMIAQKLDGSRRPLRYNALASCMDKLAKEMDFYVADEQLKEIHCPMFGAGLAGGDWEFVKELIRDCWIDKGINVTVHTL